MSYFAPHMVVVLTIVFSTLGLATTPTTVLLSGAPSPATFGQPVTLSASVAPAGATGKITFYDGVTVLGTGQLTNGLAVLSTRLLPAGSRSLSAFYAGDANFAPGSSTPAPLIVQTVAGNGFENLPATASVFAGLAVADFNGDGKLDLVGGGAGATVLLGKGDGTFASPTSYPAVGSTTALAIGDFDADGYLDIALVGSALKADTVSILRGNGNGTFQLSVTYDAEVGGGAAALAVADLNADGIADLVVGGQGGISMFLGIGNGTFQPPVSYQLAPYVGAIVMADFNADGKVDVAVANGFVNIFLGNGDGSLQPPTIYSTNADALGLVTADFNGDGKPDLIASNSRGSGVLLGIGNGTFVPVPNYQVGGTVLDMFAVGDFRATGAADLVIAAATSCCGGSVGVAFNTGSDFTPPIAYSLPGLPPFISPPSYLRPSSVIVADFNGDGRADIAVAAGLELTILLNRSVPESTITLTSSLNASTYGESVTFTAALASSAGVPAGSVAFYDGAASLGSSVFDGDRATLTTTRLPAGSHPITAIYSGNANTGYGLSPILVQTVSQIAATTNLTVSPNPSSTGQNILLQATVSTSVATGMVTFMDGSTPLGSSPVNAGLASLFVSTLTPGTHALMAVYNGDANVSASQSAAVSQIVNPGAATSVTLTTSSNFSYYGPNLRVIGTVSPPSATGKLTFYDGTSVIGVRPVVDGRATLTTALLMPGLHSLKAYYAGDSAYAPSASSFLSQRVMTSIPSFGYRHGSRFPANGGWIRVDDFNSDGHADLLFQATGSPQSYIATALGNGDGTFQSPTLVYRGSSQLTGATGDFNGDSITDVIVCDSTANSYNVALGNGDGTFRDPVSYSVNFNPSSINVADFNGDGIADLVMGSSSGGGFGVLLGNGDGTFQPAVPGSLAAGSLAVADFNGDGNPDLVAGFRFGNLVRVLLGHGDGTFAAPIDTPGYYGDFSVQDLNNDGKPDLVISGVDDNLTVLAGNGDGTFQPMATLPAGSGPVAIGDIDGDGQPDIVSGAGVRFGQRDGNWLPFLALSASNLGNIALGDFSGDGRMDVVSALVGVILGAGQGRLQFTIQPDDGAIGKALPPVVVEVRDFDGNKITTYAPTAVALTSVPEGVSESVTAVNGTARFSNIFFSGPGTYTFNASSPGLNTVTSQPFQIVSMGPASNLTVRSVGR